MQKPISDFEKFLSLHPGESLEEVDNIPVQFLIDTAQKYSIEPGTRYYFPNGHPSGLGCLHVYFPRRIKTFLAPSGNSSARDTEQGLNLPSQQMENCQHLSFFEFVNRRFAQKLSQWLQHAKKLFHLSSWLLLLSSLV